MESEEKRCRVNSQGDLKQVGWPWEVLSKFGNPWADFASFRGKALGSRMRIFASESPGNDQFSLIGSFAIPRVFHKRTNFDQDRFRPSKTNLKPKGPIFETRDYGASRARAQSGFPLCTGRSPLAQKIKEFAEIYFYLLRTYLICRESSGSFFFARNPNFLEFSQGEAGKNGI
jgi:hypothetical protein